MTDEELLEAGLAALGAHGLDALFSPSGSAPPAFVDGEPSGEFLSFIESIDSEVFPSKVLSEWIDKKFQMAAPTTISMTAMEVVGEDYEDLNPTDYPEQFMEVIAKSMARLAQSLAFMTFYVGWQSSAIRHDGLSVERTSRRTSGPDLVNKAIDDIIIPEKMSEDDLRRHLMAIWDVSEAANLAHNYLELIQEKLDLNLDDEASNRLGNSFMQLFYIGLRVGQMS